MGKHIKINLNNNKTTISQVDKSIIKEYLGGRGLGAYLYSKNPKKAESPDNSVFIVPGILTGSIFPSSSRLEVVTSSPLTNLYTASSAGGNFGAYLKHNDVDATEIVGQAKSWKYIVLENDKVEYHDASHLVGKSVTETEEIIRNNFKGKDISIATIGPAGENLIKYATLLFDKRAAGRTGTGWHFGYKKLKALVIVDKDALPNPTDLEKLTDLNRVLLKRKIENDKTTDTYCTPAYTEYANSVQAYPASNYQRNFVSEQEISKISLEEYRKHGLKKESCWRCPLACTQLVTDENGKAFRGPEYETIWSLGANCDNFDFDQIIECNRLCDEYGLDTVSTGSVLGWYKECIDKNLADDKWSKKRMQELIGEIAFRKGVGSFLAEGVVMAAKNLGFGEKLVVHSKNLELPAWDPRTAIGMALNYVTAPTGGDHCKGWTVGEDTKDPKLQFETKGKAKNVVEKQDNMALLDSLGTCMFAEFMYDLKIWSEILDVYLDVKLSVNKLKDVGKRVFQTEYEINKKLGHDFSNPDNLNLPEKIIDYEIEVNGKKVQLTSKMLKEMIEEYIVLRNW